MAKRVQTQQIQNRWVAVPHAYLVYIPATDTGPLLCATTELLCPLFCPDACASFFFFFCENRRVIEIIR